MDNLKNTIFFINILLKNLIFMVPDKDLIEYSNNVQLFPKNIIKDFIDYFYTKQYIHEINYSKFDDIDKFYANKVNFKKILQQLSPKNKTIIRNNICNIFNKICNENIFDILEIPKIRDHNIFCLYLTRPQHSC